MAQSKLIKFLKYCKTELSTTKAKVGIGDGEVFQQAGLALATPTKNVPNRADQPSEADPYVVDRRELRGELCGYLARWLSVFLAGYIKDKRVPQGRSNPMTSDIQQELQPYLEGVHFAANTEDLVSIAMSNGAPEELIEQLEDLPRREFSNLEEVVEAIEDLRAS